MLGLGLRIMRKAVGSSSSHVQRMPSYLKNITRSTFLNPMFSSQALNRIPLVLQRCKTSVLWDTENVPIPISVDPCYLSRNIQRSLQKCNFFGPMTIIAVGNFQNLKGGVDEILHLTGVEMDYVKPLKIQRKTISEKSDKRILVRMSLWINKNRVPSNILLVTGDGGFADAMNEWGMLGYNFLLAHPDLRSRSYKLEFVATTIWAWSTLAAGGLPTIYHQTIYHNICTRDRYANGPVSRVLEAINQLEAKGIMATVGNISTLIQQNHPGAHINLEKSLNIAVKIDKVTKEEGTPPFYVTRRGAQIDSFINTFALAESKAYQKAAATCSIHSMRESLLEETEEIYNRCLALFALRHHGGEDAVNVIIESLGVESSMIRIEAAFVLGQLESKTAIAPLSKILRDVKEHPMVRVEAAKALGFIADEKSREVLQELSGDLDPIIAKACDSSLSILEFKNSGKSGPLI